MSSDNILTRIFKLCINNPLSDTDASDKDCGVITNLTDSIREIAAIVSSDVCQDELPNVDDLTEVICGKHNLATFEKQKCIRRMRINDKMSADKRISEHATSIMVNMIPDVWYKIETDCGSIGIVTIRTLSEVVYIKERGCARTPRTLIAYACYWEDRSKDIELVSEKHSMMINYDARTGAERAYDGYEHDVVSDTIIKFFGGKL